MFGPLDLSCPLSSLIIELMNGKESGTFLIGSQPSLSLAVEVPGGPTPTSLARSYTLIFLKSDNLYESYPVQAR